MSDLASGMRVGSYHLTSLIGQTHMSEVWQAKDWNGTIVALKTISAQAGEDPQLRARFLREGGEHQQLSHPAIVPILDFFEQNGSFYLVMQYLSGGSLEDKLEANNWNPLPISDALSISRRILSALDYAHQRLIIHRDVKPSNILLDGNRAFLGDFGIALALGRPRLTTVAQVLGTRCYMSPEQIQSPLNVTHLTDVYSYGCVLYEMLTGQQPYPQENGSDEGLYNMLARRVHEAPVPPRQCNPEISVRLERIVLTSLASDPQDRFPGCGSFARALEAVERENAAKPLVTPVAGPPLKPSQIVLPMVQPPVLLVPESQRVSVAGNVGAAIVAGALWVPFLGMRYDDWSVIVLLCAILSNVLFLRMLYKGWAALPAKLARTTPGKAIGFLFIPFFHLYWCWNVVPGMAVDYSHYWKQSGRQELAWQLNFLKLFCLFHFYLPWLAVFVLPPKTFNGWVILPDLAVLIPIVVTMIAKIINDLPAESAEQRSPATVGMEQGLR